MKRIWMLAVLLIAATSANAQDRPNVVLMLADNVGYGDIGTYGAGEVRGMPTPRIDSIASQGLRLTQYLVEPACTPSRAALMTGRYSVRSGLSSVIVGGTPNTLQASEVTLGELFKSAGYATGALKKVRPYAVENRGQVEGEIAKASVEFIERRAKAGQPFFLQVGFTYTHYPLRTAPEFVGKSRIGPYGDAIMELDYRTGQILDAIKAAGIEDTTIVIWISDNAAAPTAGPSDTRFGFNGPFRGELGDATEGAVRTIGMVKWPGKIAPRASNEMFSVHDWFPTLASIVGAKAPTDRPIDGVDQSAFITGKQEKSSRESLIAFVGDEIAAVRWRQFRIYPKQFAATPGNPAMNGLAGSRIEGNGFPFLFNIEADPREEMNVVGLSGWVIAPYLQTIGAYLKSLEMYPNPKAVNMTNFGGGQ